MSMNIVVKIDMTALNKKDILCVLHIAYMYKNYDIFKFMSLENIFLLISRSLKLAYLESESELIGSCSIGEVGRPIVSNFSLHFFTRLDSRITKSDDKKSFTNMVKVGLSPLSLSSRKLKF